ncbi:MAG: hypothetical protein EPN85_13805, partial [Bacteroidetes bacterium]
MFSVSSHKRIFIGVAFLFCITFFLWTDAAVDPTLALRQTYLAAVLFGAVLFCSLKGILFTVPVSLLRSKPLLLLAGYILLSWISIIHTHSFDLSLFELSKVTLFYFLVLFFCRLCVLSPAPSFSWKSSFLRIMTGLLTISSALLVVIGYAEFFYYTKFFEINIQKLNNLVYATFGNRNIFSEMVLLFIPFQVICFFQNKNRWIRRGMAVLVLLSLILLLLMETRACWAALAGSSVIFLLLTVKKWHYPSLNKKKLAIGMVVVLILSAGALPAYK